MPSIMPAAEYIRKHKKGPPGVRCPGCGQARSQVVDKRNAGNRIKRRRACVCGQRFNTIEIVQPTRVNFSVAKAKRLRFDEKLKYKDIAKVLGVSVSTAWWAVNDH